MKHLGKKIIRYGDIEVVGDEYLIEISDDLFIKIINCGDRQLLESVLKEQIKHENYEAADIIQKALKNIP